jgi:hypothetical protein
MGLTRAAGKPSRRHCWGRSTAYKVSMPATYLGCRSIIWSQRMRNRPYHLARRLVLALPLIRDLPQQIVLGPSQVGHFHDYLRPHPVHARQLERRAEVPRPWLHRCLPARSGDGRDCGSSRNPFLHGCSRSTSRPLSSTADAPAQPRSPGALGRLDRRGDPRTAGCPGQLARSGTARCRRASSESKKLIRRYRRQTGVAERRRLRPSLGVTIAGPVHVTHRRLVCPDQSRRRSPSRTRRPDGPTA